MSKLYHEEMEDCPCQQGLRCSMNGDFCREGNCAPLFLLRKIGPPRKVLIISEEKVANPEEAILERDGYADLEDLNPS